MYACTVVAYLLRLHALIHMLTQLPNTHTHKNEEIHVVTLQLCPQHYYKNIFRRFFIF
jgi:hypothetical protein